MEVPTYFDAELPSVEHLRRRAARRVPRFAFEYLEGGCNAEVNLQRNTNELREVRLMPVYLQNYPGAKLETELFGKTYAAPFGVAPIGLQGLVWPDSCQALARAATEHQLPFILSTVGTGSIEEIGQILQEKGGTGWYQLYHPAEDSLRDGLLDRAEAAGFSTLVALADTPTFAYRPKEIRNGLSLPPRMSLRNVWQMLQCPRWCFGQLRHGSPKFRTLERYLPPGLNLKHLGQFMNRTFSGRLSPERLRAMRARWKGPLVVKGIVNAEDARLALNFGADGLIVSNHGGRQLDAGESTLHSLQRLVEEFSGKTTLMLDSGIRGGPDLAAALASGAKFTFLGRSFMYGAAAMGENGGKQVMYMLKRQLQQVLEQLGCPTPAELPQHLIR